MMLEQRLSEVIADCRKAGMDKAAVLEMVEALL